jgi:hypothetical protein
VLAVELKVLHLDALTWVVEKASISPVLNWSQNADGMM